jgi:hypothetical protein
MVHLDANFANGITFYLLKEKNIMIPGDPKQDTAGEKTKQPGEAQVAKNPNPRANENIRERIELPGTESADMEDEVGTEITDGEDG